MTKHSAITDRWPAIELEGQITEIVPTRWAARKIVTGLPQDPSNLQPVMEKPLTKSLTAEQRNTAGYAPRLRRVLTLWDLIFYGIVLIMPIAPVPMFGVAQVLSHGHFVTTILIAVMLTAVSYGRMATLFPAAGSAYTYVAACMEHSPSSAFSLSFLTPDRLRFLWRS